MCFEHQVNLTQVKDWNCKYLQIDRVVDMIMSRRRHRRLTSTFYNVKPTLLVLLKFVVSWFCDANDGAVSSSSSRIGFQ